MSIDDKIEEWTDQLGKTPKIIKVFPKAGTFKAIHNAEAYIKEQGYKQGPLCGDAPIALSNNPKIESIAMWKNIPRGDWHRCDGVILSEDFREDDVAVVLF